MKTRYLLLLFFLLAPIAARADGFFSYTPIKHATLVLQTDRTTIYVDPVGEAANFGSLPPPDLILVTHIHRDHLAPQLIEALKQADSEVIGSPTVVEQLGYGTTMRNGDTIERAGLTITALPAYNLTPERLNFHPRGRDNGYLVSKGDETVYLSGDTEDTPEMRALSGVDIAFVCMNLPFTMTVEQAASAVNQFQPGVVIPYHYRGKPDMSDLDAFETLVKGPTVKRLDWY
jgi:L-ascorbate metabolism protein UlaG (beta-lactamase superfamily)